MHWYTSIFFTTCDPLPDLLGKERFATCFTYSVGVMLRLLGLLTDAMKVRWSHNSETWKEMILEHDVLAFNISTVLFPIAAERLLRSGHVQIAVVRHAAILTSS